MRVLVAIGAAFVMAWLVPAASRADAPGPTAAAPAQPGCKCPPPRPHRQVRHHRRGRMLAMLPPPPIGQIYYNNGIPSPWDSAYDRAMTLHFRSPFVTGVPDPEPGYPHTPPVRAVSWYRYPSGPAVYQYDGITEEYIALSQYDAQRVFPVAAAAAPAAAQ